MGKTFGSVFIENVFLRNIVEKCMFLLRMKNSSKNGKNLGVSTLGVDVHISV